MEYRGKHRKMRLSTKIGLIRLMRSKGMNISYTAIFSKAA